MIKNVLSIAGSDPSGGAGVQADLKTFGALGAHGMAVVTALTAQNTRSVRGVHPVPACFVRDQLAAIFDDIRVDAVKIGMVSSAESVHMIADTLAQYDVQRIVLDPVMVATSGDPLIDDDAIAALREVLVPLASVVTPNAHEAVILGDVGVPCLVKGGHDDGDLAIDVLSDGARVQEFSVPRIETNNTHGTGCTLSSAIAVYLAQGKSLPMAVQAAKDYLSGALMHADDLDVGSGHGPVHHFWNFYTASHLNNDNQAFSHHAGSALSSDPQSRVLGASGEGKRAAGRDE